MMKKTALLLLAILTAYPFKAEQVEPKDSTATKVDIEEIVIIASPKETSKLKQLPASVSLLSQKELQAYQLKSLRNISGIVPNFYIPDYGSRLTSAVYIRGIGARINTPAVGLYVDNIPYIDKSAFDFNYYDIERIDVLRGPQGTLYGRNTMGGLIKVHTKSPFSYQGTDLKLSAGNYTNYNGSLTHYHRISNSFAFSAGGFYEYSGGVFENTYLKKKADGLQSGGGRIRSIWLPTDNLKVDATLSYEYTDQGGYAYGLYHEDTGIIDPVSTNDESSYYRSLLNAGVNIEYQADHFILSAVTGYQHLKDRMFLDQDFTARDVYNITQKQRLNTISEEIVLKSTPQKRWQWITGVFGLYQWLHTDAPVLFKKDAGMTQLIQTNTNSLFEGLSAANPNMPQMHIDINHEDLLVNSKFDTPIMNVAIFHQSAFHDLFTPGLSLTIGLRLDYEKINMTYETASKMDFNFTVQPPRSPMAIRYDHLSTEPISGKENSDYLQLLPKFALKYDFNPKNNLYASVSKGYRSGGYNIQMFSDIAQTELRNAMLQSIGKAGNMEDMVKRFMTESLDIEETTIYKPEISWSYEIGTHLSLFNNSLQADITAFYMDTRDQQIARFSENGLGRMTVNAGKSRSIGAEAALHAQISSGFAMNLSYGYTHATFTDYKTNNKNNIEIDYSGNYVPMAPRHTLTIGGDYTFLFSEKALIDRFSINAYYSGAGKLYWTEENNISQDFYGTLNCRLSAMMKDIQVDVWGKNLWDEKYTAFYFESFGNKFMQSGKPIQFGVDIKYRF